MPDFLPMPRGRTFPATNKNVCGLSVRFPAPFRAKRAEANEYETHDFYVASRCLEAAVGDALQGPLTCGITPM
jgi:hypothetical protein